MVAKSRPLTVAAALLLWLLAQGAALGLGGEASFPFVDDFDNADSGWVVYDSGSGRSDYRNGEFVLSLPKTHQTAISRWAPLREPCPEAFVVEATAYRLSGGEDPGYGIIWGLDDDNYYVLRVRGDGSFRVMWEKDGQWQIDPVPVTASDAILRGSSPNHLRVVVSGDRAAIAINEKDLGTIDLPMKGPYAVGVFATTVDTIPAEARFTQFSVSVPSAEEATQALAVAPVVMRHALPFTDDFDDPKSGWRVYDDEAGGFGYRANEYAVWLSTTERSYHTWAPLREPCPETFVVEATAYRLSGGANATFGILWGIDKGNYYALCVRGDGSFSVLWKRDNNWQDTLIPWTWSKSILGAKSPNHLRVVITGGQAAIAINGKDLRTIDLPMKGPYAVGVCGTSGNTIPAEARFTQFSVAPL